MAKSVGILTGGGDCPGLNAVIRAVVRRADAAGWDVVAVREGWRGLVEPIFEDLGPSQVSGILPRGGTIIGTSRTNPFNLEGGVDDRAAAREDPRYLLRTEILEDRVNEAAPAFAHGDDVPTGRIRPPDDGPDDRVQPGAVAAAGEDADALRHAASLDAPRA